MTQRATLVRLDPDEIRSIKNALKSAESSLLIAKTLFERAPIYNIPVTEESHGAGAKDPDSQRSGPAGEGGAPDAN